LVEVATIKSEVEAKRLWWVGREWNREGGEIKISDKTSLKVRKAIRIKRLSELTTYDV
jgi:hypothetical protein